MEAQKLIHAAISDATRDNYAGPQRLYREWCEANERQPLPVTPVNLADWLAHESCRTDKYRAARTIGVYRSAISAMHEESHWAGGPSPVDDPRVQRLMQGIVNVKNRVDVAARAKKRADGTIDLTPAILADLEPHAGLTDQPRDAMMWAAICLGTFGLLRPSEFLGSAAHPERALSPDQIRFCRTASGIKAEFPPEGSSDTPDHFELHLGATKADQAGKNPPVRIAARIAVQAMWRWMIARRAMIRASSPSKCLFATPGSGPISMKDIAEFLRDWFARAGLGRPPISGRAFRRGGASALVEGNVPAADAAAAGRWRTPAMVQLYASREAKRAQALTISRAMGR